MTAATIRKSSPEDPRVSQAVSSAVRVSYEPLRLPTYEPLPPDRNPMFLEKRVYQGSSGKVYPLPFYDRISETPVLRDWRAITLENEFVRVVVLPEIGGRIHIFQDKTTGYDLIYNQKVIKPALVGLAGPWASGGIEFNWPQHHRPATYMPVDTHVQTDPDGSITVWMSDHDPMLRLKGMHGVRLSPGSSALELRVRLTNRTPFTQTFLWWANVATQVHEQYQSFFPPDVSYVADHAKRAMSRYPLCDDHYYGVPYGERARNGVPESERPPQFVPVVGQYAPNDLSWYANIPVPTSYMCMDSRENFFGGYDHRQQAGIVHVADHHISPGKKQWTWGNHPFGYAWDRNLTDADDTGVYHPYIELMAGVFTDNQPDFSFLAPGETRTFTQTWYPIHQIGPAQKANLDAALSLTQQKAGVRIGVSATRRIPNARIELRHDNTVLWSKTITLTPGTPFVESIATNIAFTSLRLMLLDDAGQEIVSYAPALRQEQPVPPAATEPPAPQEVASADELYTIGLHLDQYRHATRHPELYWREALRRDPLDSRCNTAMGFWHLRRGEFDSARQHFQKAIERQISRNPNPRDGESYYGLGYTLFLLERYDDAYDALYKATWSQAWQSAAFEMLGRIDVRRRRWNQALEHLNQSLRRNADNLRARHLKAIALRALDQGALCNELLNENLGLDPLDWLSRFLRGDDLTCDTATRLDLAIDLAHAGQYQSAIDILLTADPQPIEGLAPLVSYYLSYYSTQVGAIDSAMNYAREAADADLTYCFPARLEDMIVLQWFIATHPGSTAAPYLLGNWMYDRRRFDEAIDLWEKSAQFDPKFPTVWRNLGIGYFNIHHASQKARDAYDKAFAADPTDARLLYERDQLWKRLKIAPTTRLLELEKHPQLIQSRDDLSVEYCALLNQVGRHDDALQLVTHRHFQPWEGGEGQALGQHVRTHVSLGRAALLATKLEAARSHFTWALKSPNNLGEARHLLANQSDVHYLLGTTLVALDQKAEAIHHLTLAAEFKGDFQGMSVRSYSEMTYYSALAARALGQTVRADDLLRQLDAYAQNLEKQPAKIDYFATSLPTMLLFDEDLNHTQTRHARLLQGQAALGLGNLSRARELFEQVLQDDPSHALASDLLKECTP